MPLATSTSILSTQTVVNMRDALMVYTTPRSPCATPVKGQLAAAHAASKCHICMSNALIGIIAVLPAPLPAGSSAISYDRHGCPRLVHRHWLLWPVHHMMFKATIKLYISAPAHDPSVCREAEETGFENVATAIKGLPNSQGNTRSVLYCRPTLQSQRPATAIAVRQNSSSLPITQFAAWHAYSCWFVLP